MMTGQQDYWSTFYNVNYRNQKILMFNKILRIKNMIEGHQRRNRLATVVIPADNDPDNGQTADQLTKALTWIMREDSTYDKISESFAGSVTCGLNLLQCWMDFREDPENGEIKTSRIPFNAFLMDNYWTKHDLSDCDRIWTRRYVTKRQLESLIPGIGKEVQALGKGYAAKDGKFQFLAQNWYQYQQEMYAYDEYWVRDFRKKRKILDKRTGELIDWTGSRDQFKQLLAINPNIELITVTAPTVKLNVLVNSNLIYEEQAPYGLDRLPFVPFTCYHFPEVQNYAYRYQGIVRNIRDSQIELNRRRNRMLDILDAQIQSGLMVKEDALVNPEDAFFQGPGKVLFFKKTANLAADKEQFQAPPMPTGWMELIASLDQEIMQIVGTPEELYGQDLNAKDLSGIMMKLKMDAGLTSLANIFDSLSVSQRMIGDIQLEMMQKNFSEHKVKKIIGEEPTDQFFNFVLTKYHTATEEASLTTTQRQLQFIQAVSLEQMFPGTVPKDFILEKSTLQGKKELIDAIKQQQQQQAQIQEAQTQQMLEQGQMLNRSIEAKAQADFAAAEERKARAVSDYALAKERSSQAQYDRAKAAVDNVKAIHELQDMSDDRLVKMSDFILSLQERQAALQSDEEVDAMEDAAITGAGVRETEQATKPQPVG